MKKNWFLILLFAMAMPVLLNGCVIARDISAPCMNQKTQDQLADRIADKVVEKLKNKGCPAAAPATAEPNIPGK